MCVKQCSHCNDGHGHQQKYYNYSYFSLSDAKLLGDWSVMLYYVYTRTNS